MPLGAGGTDGGIGGFVLGFAMFCAGAYLLLNGIIVRPVFGFGAAMYRIGTFPITTGMILIPFMFGVGIIFYSGRNLAGWALAIGSVIALIVGVIANTQLQFARMSAFELLVILILLVGGIALFLRSLRDYNRR